MAYLSRRCEEGRRAVAALQGAVAALQGKTHRYKGVPSLSDAHADLLQFQSDCGGMPSSFLACSL